MGGSYQKRCINQWATAEQKVHTVATIKNSYKIPLTKNLAKPKNQEGFNNENKSMGKKDRNCGLGTI
ncbi:MAG: hypothetical protein DSY83_15830 [Flavobacteriia bacterium]|nr:MAG: hypothetical protein DSY83_15830 [Flavobacteriia bacterium]